MKRILKIILLFIILWSCKKNYKKKDTAYDFVPHNSDYIYSLKEASLLNDYSNSSVLPNIELEHATFLNTYIKIFQPDGRLVIAGKKNTAKNQITIITRQANNSFENDSLPPHETKEGENIVKTIIQDRDTLYWEKTRDFNIVTNTKNRWNKELQNDHVLSETSKHINDFNRPMSLAFKKTSELSKLLFQQNELDSTLFEVGALDFEMANNIIKYNGIVKGKDTLDYINVFKNNQPQELETHKILPEGTISFQNITYADYNTFAKNLYSLKKQQRDSTKTILNTLNQLASFKLKDGKGIVLSALDSNAFSDIISQSNEHEVFKDVSIYKFADPSFFYDRLSPFIVFKDASYFVVMEKFAVFSNSPETLKNIITSKLNNKILATSNAFKSVLENLSDESSFMIYKQKGEARKFFPNLKYGHSAIQFIYESHFAHVNACLKNYEKPAPKNSVEEHFSVELPNDLILPPQTVRNHLTKNHDIITQDVKNIVYLISESGKIYWQKRLDSKIQGNIEQIDIFKNGRLQMAFATEKRVYVIDRNGKDVGKFPLKLSSEITQPLSVFDYDKKKDYRLLVTQGKSLSMYNTKGNRVEGFKYNGADKTIKTQPKHFRISGKDYIVFAQGTGLEILNRIGKTRIPVKGKIRFSNNGIYLYQNKFSTSNQLGELIQVNTKGKINKRSLKLADSHYMTSTSKTLVTLSDNSLKIRSRDIALEYGNYTRPQIFYLNDKIYVSTTDKQSKKVYLFDSQASSIPNFPVFGTTDVDLQKLDGDSAIELITQTGSKTITVYKIN